jgi:hypothetical protein
VRIFLCLIVTVFLFSSGAPAQKKNIQSAEPPAAQKSLKSKGADEGDDAQSSIGADYKVDTSSTTDFNLDANFQSRGGTHFLIGYETTRSPPSDSQTISIDTSELRLGAGSESKNFSFTVNYALWGAPDQISTNTFGADLKWLNDNWISELEPQLRFVAVPIQDDTILKKNLGDGTPKNLTISDPSIAGMLNFIGLDPWHFRGRLAYYSYSRDLATIFSSRLSRFFSSSAINSANNFNEFEASGEIGYAFKFVTLAFEYLYAVSALDYSVQPSYTGKSIFTFIKDVDIELDGGQTPGIGAGAAAVNFVSLGLTKYW